VQEEEEVASIVVVVVVAAATVVAGVEVEGEVVLEYVDVGAGL